MQEFLDGDNFFDVAEIEEVVKVKEERLIKNEPTTFTDVYGGFGTQNNTVTVQGGNYDDFFNVS